MSSPSISTWPALGVTRPPSTFSRVLLPLPDGPTTLTHDPVGIVMSVPRSAIVSSWASR